MNSPSLHVKYNSFKQSLVPNHKIHDYMKSTFVLQLMLYDFLPIYKLFFSSPTHFCEIIIKYRLTHRCTFVGGSNREEKKNIAFRLCICIESRRLCALKI